jgi:sensor c-di-GMP phosphodiesterase-like protein
MPALTKLRPRSLTLWLAISLVFSVLFFVGGSSLRYSDMRDDLTRDVKRSGAALQALGFDIANVVGSLEARSQTTDTAACSAESLSFLRGLEFSSLLFSDIAVINNDAVICSTTRGVLQSPVALNARPLPISFPDIDSSFIYYNAEESFVDPRVRGNLFRFGDILLSLDDRGLFTDEGSATKVAFLAQTESGLVRLFDGESTDVVSATPDFFSALTCLDRSNLCVFGTRQASQYADAAIILLVLALAFGLTIGVIATVVIENFIAKRSTLQLKLKQAIADGKLFAEYQPIVEMETGAVKGCEALVRWIDDDGQRIRPDIFIAIAEASNFTDEITDYMLRYTAKHFWSRATLKDIRVAINLSPTEAIAPNFVERYETFFKTWNIEKKNVRLEITERVQADLAQFEKALDRICAAGFSMSLDDFGTGHASFPYLRRLKLDAIKLDRSFTIAVGEDSAYGRMLPHLIDMIKSLRIAVVVEGVEDEKQKEWFLARGSMLAQGYYYSKPLGIDAFEAYALKHNSPAPTPAE